MSAKRFDLDFVGFRMEGGLKNWPEKSGIYCVYRCLHYPDKSQVSIRGLVYIGEAENLRTRLGSHEKFELWRKCLQAGEVLCFSYALVSNDDRERCEAAMIFKHQPTENTKCRDSFNYDETQIALTGVTSELVGSFAVRRSS